MSVGIFIEKKVQPTEAQIIEALGPSLPVWQELAAHLRATYPVTEEYKFMYGKNYGWALKFNIKSQLLTALYPAQDCFFAQVNLPPEGVERALGMPLGANARRAIDGAHPYPEGRWVFARVESATDAEDIRKLLVVRVETKRLVK
jgi:hypothetical protein